MSGFQYGEKNKNTTYYSYPNFVLNVEWLIFSEKLEGIFKRYVKQGIGCNNTNYLLTYFRLKSLTASEVNNYLNQLERIGSLIPLNSHTKKYISAIRNDPAKLKVENIMIKTLKSQHFNLMMSIGIERFCMYEDSHIKAIIL